MSLPHKILFFLPGVILYLVSIGMAFNKLNHPAYWYAPEHRQERKNYDLKKCYYQIAGAIYLVGASVILICQRKDDEETPEKAED